MSRFPSAAHLASWAGICPGSNESAGKRKTGKTRKGIAGSSRCWWGVGGGWAGSSRRYLGAQYARLARRRGKRKAALAVGHTPSSWRPTISCATASSTAISAPITSTGSPPHAPLRAPPPAARPSGHARGRPARRLRSALSGETRVAPARGLLDARAGERDGGAQSPGARCSASVGGRSSPPWWRARPILTASWRWPTRGCARSGPRCPDTSGRIIASCCASTCGWSRRCRRRLPSRSRCDGRAGRWADASAAPAQVRRGPGRSAATSRRATRQSCGRTRR
jgi:hypothetical protein